MASSNEGSFESTPVLERDDVLLVSGRLWRVCRRPHADLSGIGAERASGRWHTRSAGARVLYCAADPSTAILEVLVRHLSEASLAPPDLVLVTIGVDREQLRGLAREQVTASFDPEWTEHVERTRACGDSWLSRPSSFALTVPSALSPAPALNVPIHASHPVCSLALKIEQVDSLASKIERALAGLRAAGR